MMRYRLVGYYIGCGPHTGSKPVTTIELAAQFVHERLAWPNAVVSLHDEHSIQALLYYDRRSLLFLGIPEAYHHLSWFFEEYDVLDLTRELVEEQDDRR